MKDKGRNSVFMHEIIRAGTILYDTILDGTCIHVSAYIANSLY